MQQRENFCTDFPLETSAEFKVSIRSVSYWADHSLLDMVVLPGSFCIERALYMDHELYNGVPNLVRNITFQNPVVLSAEDTVVKVEARHCGDNRIEYTFYENVEDRASSDRQYAARLEVILNTSRLAIVSTEGFAIEKFQAESHAVIDKECFYRTLRENGNQYGPSFQNVSAIWRAGNESLAQLNVVTPDGQIEPHVVHPATLDSITQILAPFIMEKGKPFILRAIDKLEVMDVDFPDTLWVHATLLSETDNDREGMVGNVRAFDESGKTYVECSGVTLTLLDAANDKRPTTIAVASNFTAEPVEDSLKFWGDYFDFPINLEFTPYNQLFQQLLDSGSAFHKNRNGVNIILLSLEDWVSVDHPATMTLNRMKAEQCFHNHARYVLPNGLEIVHLNQYETEYLYKEIFEDQCYLRHGIRLQDGDTVVDIGANIGLFSLFVMTHCRDSRIYAFEPAPAVYELLKANCEAYGSNVRVVNAGVSDKSETALLTFYKTSSVFSGFHADEAEDRQAIRAIVRSMLEIETSAEREDLDSYVDELIAGRLSRQTHQCQLVSVSEIIRKNRLEKINLLKIDAEKSELEIINGIEEGDWPKIDQLVIEIHDPTREVVKQIEDLLVRKGFRCVVAQESLLKRSGLFNLHATRVEGEQQPLHTSNLQRNVQDFCVALRSFMSELTVPLILSVCPPAPATEANAELMKKLSDAEQALMSEVGTILNVHTIGSKLPLRLYPVTDYYDPHSRVLGHIPYTTEGYAAIGSALYRSIFNLNRKPFKVIVVDCDDTLWGGACAEVGPMGVEISSPYRAFQEFMIDQMNAGKLLCLCSKNNESDVLAVFDRRTDLVLKREHLVSWRINWKSKSENIQSLAEELNLGLDSFIFIDDNPVECADVRINAPQVLTLQLPRSSSSISSFLHHMWAFDNTGSTVEDRNRTRLYQENAKRQQFHEQTLSLKDFIKGLQLRIEITDASDDQLLRVSQLTFRTNQFNFTTIRRSENEIRELLRLEQFKCQVVRVSDRFGDYGLVGVVMYETRVDSYKVDTFLISCRVLGRGVEHAIMSHLGQQALRANKKFVELTCVPTEKNLPARNFIKNVGGHFRDETGTHWTLPTEYLANLEYEPDEQAKDRHEISSVSDLEASKHKPTPRFGVDDLSSRLQQLATGLSDIRHLVKAIEEYRLIKQPPPKVADVSGATPIQMAVMTIWKRVLGHPRIGVNDNFFEVGGTSLKAVQVIAMIKKELKQNLSIISLFEYPTITLLAGKLSGTAGPNGSNNSAAVLRGEKRLMNVRRRAR